MRAYVAQVIVVGIVTIVMLPLDGGRILRVIVVIIVLAKRRFLDRWLIIIGLILMKQAHSIRRPLVCADDELAQELVT